MKSILLIGLGRFGKHGKSFGNADDKATGTT